MNIIEEFEKKFGRFPVGQYGGQEYYIFDVCGEGFGKKELGVLIAEWVEKKINAVHKGYVKYNTVLVKPTASEDNLTDLANAYAHFGFVAKMSEQELVDNIKHVVAEQYTQSILKANQSN